MVTPKTWTETLVMRQLEAQERKLKSLTRALPLKTPRAHSVFPGVGLHLSSLP